MPPALQTQKTAGVEGEPQWGNSWWRSDSGGRETFARILETKRAEHTALHPQEAPGPGQAAGAREFPLLTSSLGGAGASVA